MSEIIPQIKDIKTWQKKTFVEKVKPYFSQAWYFDQWYEKLILVGLGILGMWKIYSFF